MKQYFKLLSPLILVILLVPGCRSHNNNTLPNSSANPSVSPSSTTSTTTMNLAHEEANSVENTEGPLYEKTTSVMDLAVILSNEMANGYFDYVTKVFDSSMQEKYSIESLYTKWNSTVSDFGKFLSLTDVKQEIEHSTCYVSTILQYENNNLLLHFTFTKNQLLSNLELQDYDSVTFSEH